MKGFNIPLTTLIISMIIGIWLSPNIKLPFYISFIVVGILLGSLYLSTKSYKLKKKPIGISFLLYTTLISFGMCTEKTNEYLMYKSHYSKLSSFHENIPQLVRLSIKQVLKPGVFYQRFIANVEIINKKNAMEKYYYTTKT